MNITPVSIINNTQIQREKNVPQSFTGVFNPIKFASATKNSSGIFQTVKDGYNKFLELGAKKFISPMVNSEALKKFADKTAKIENVPIHLSVFGAAVTSGFYVKSTLQNENLAKKERKTLALNQALVFGVSTLGAYTFNKSLESIVKNVKHKYIKYNHEHPKLGTRIDGFKTASGLLVFALMYRYIAPVVVTPIASWISKKVREHKEANAAQATQNN